MIVTVIDAVEPVTTAPPLVSTETRTVPRLPPCATLPGIVDNASFAAVCTLAVTVNVVEAAVSPLLVAAMV